jgi:hypothetical protein
MADGQGFQLRGRQAREENGSTYENSYELALGSLKVEVPWEGARDHQIPLLESDKEAPKEGTKLGDAGRLFLHMDTNIDNFKARLAS